MKVVRLKISSCSLRLVCVFRFSSFNDGKLIFSNHQLKTLLRNPIDVSAKEERS